MTTPWRVMMLLICAGCFLLAQYIVSVYRRGRPEIFRENDTIESLVASEHGPTTEEPTQRLADMADFRYLINSEGCPAGTPIFAVLLIGSHPQHHELRDVVRSTWNNLYILGFPVRLLFPFGQLEDKQLQLSLDQESKYHGDILQGNFADGYRNVTLRDLMAMRWVWQRCPQAKYVIHVDDDTSMDVFSLIDSLQRDFGNLTDFVGCIYIWHNAAVLREGRYELDRTVHPSDIYEDYCSGWMYVMTPATARGLDDAALTVQPYWMNDAYITGTLVSATNRSLHQIDLKWTMGTEEMLKMLEDWEKVEKIKPAYGIGPNGGNIGTALRLHARYQIHAILNGIPKSEHYFLNRSSDSLP